MVPAGETMLEACDGLCRSSFCGASRRSIGTCSAPLRRRGPVARPGPKRPLPGRQHPAYRRRCKSCSTAPWANSSRCRKPSPQCSTKPAVQCCDSNDARLFTRHSGRRPPGLARPPGPVTVTVTVKTGGHWRTSRCSGRAHRAPPRPRCPRARRAGVDHRVPARWSAGLQG